VTAPKITPLPPRSAKVISANDTDLRQVWSGWLRNLYNTLKPGITVTITTAKLTAGGANGSMTFQNGILIAQTPAT
jgi:hypothetical protein